MNKMKQCIYTLILLVTCLVASPMIYKQIWNNSQEKKKAESYKPPAIDLSSPQTTQPQEDSTQPSEPSGSDNPSVTPSDSLQSTEATSDSQPSTEAPSEYQQITYVQTDPSYFDDALFIGDSRTVGIRDYGTLKNATYFCDVGLAASKLDRDSVASIVGGKTFGKIYIMLGINEVGNDFEFTVSKFRTVIDAIREFQPDATVYLLANLHVTAAAQQAGITNERINYLNSRISEFADYEKIFYLDINPVFDDEYGNLRPDCTGDGIHVYASHYKTWCDWFAMYIVSNT